MAIVLVIVRAVIGFGIASHGAQKLFGAFGGSGLPGTGRYFEKLGFRPGWLFALAAGLGELAGGLCTALGLIGPIAPALVVEVMTVAMITVHIRNGFFAAANGIEMPLAYAAGALLLTFAGPGPYSLDVLLGLTWLWTTPARILAAVAAVAVGLAVSAVRRAPAVAESA